MSGSGTQDTTNTDDVVPPPAAIKSPVNKAIEKVGGVAGTIASSIFDGASAVASLVAGSPSKAKAGDCNAEQTSPEVWGASGNIAKGTNTGDISGNSDGGRARLSAEILTWCMCIALYQISKQKKENLNFIVVCFVPLYVGKTLWMWPLRRLLGAWLWTREKREEQSWTWMAPADGRRPQSWTSP